MNQEEADQDVVDEVSEEVESRGKVMRIAKRTTWFKEERVGGRARVTTDEDRVLRGVWREIKSHKQGG